MIALSFSDPLFTIAWSVNISIIIFSLIYFVYHTIKCFRANQRIAESGRFDSLTDILLPVCWNHLFTLCAGCLIFLGLQASTGLINVTLQLILSPFTLAVLFDNAFLLLLNPTYYPSWGEIGNRMKTGLCWLYVNVVFTVILLALYFLVDELQDQDSTILIVLSVVITLSQVPPLIWHSLLLGGCLPYRKHGKFIVLFLLMAILSRSLWLGFFFGKTLPLYINTNSMRKLLTGDLTWSTIWLLCTSVETPIYIYLFRGVLVEETAYWRGDCVNKSMSLTWINRVWNQMRLPSLESISDRNVNTLLSIVNRNPDLFIDFAFLSISEKIAAGGNATVFRGVYLGKTVAIKILRPPEIDRILLEEYEREFSLAASLRHPHIVRFWGICVAPPTLCFVMNYYSRGSLTNSLSLIKDMRFEEQISRMLEVASAIAYLHSRRVVHRDIKPDNVLLDSRGRFYLSDFGTCRQLATDDERRSSRIGTAEFMAPEMHSGQPYSVAVDVFALGLLMWQVVSGECSPFPTLTSAFELRKAIIAGLRPPRLQSRLVHKLTAEIMANHGLAGTRGFRQSPDPNPELKDEPSVSITMYKGDYNITTGMRDKRFAPRHPRPNKLAKHMCQNLGATASTRASGQDMQEVRVCVYVLTCERGIETK